MVRFCNAEVVAGAVAGAVAAVLGGAVVVGSAVGVGGSSSESSVLDRESSLVGMPVEVPVRVPEKRA